MFYRKASPPSNVKSSGQSILLLHGKSFTSETWQKLGTMHLMAGIGHVVIAVDLPGLCLVCCVSCLNIVTVYAGIAVTGCQVL
jgi:pimeloyl-ACP methyl ester carboxylesterase